MIVTFKRAIEIVSEYTATITTLAIIAQVLAVLEILTLSFIYPIFTLVIDNSDSNYSERLHYKILSNFISEENYLSFSLIMAFLLVLFSSGFRIFLIRKTNFSVADLRQKITQKIFSAYLSKNYKFYLQSHRSEITKNILSEVDLFVIGYLLPTLAIVTNITIVIYIFVFLAVLSPEITLATLVFFGISYGLIFYIAKLALIDSGTLKVDANKRRFSIVNNAIGGIREVILSGSKGLFESEFLEPNKTFSTMTARIQTIAQSPRYIIEGLMLCAILSLLSFALHLESNGKSLFDLPLIATFALAALKVMPSIQLVYHSFAQVRSSDASVLSIYKVVNGLDDDLRNIADVEKVTFKNELVLTDVSFLYPGTQKIVLNNVNLSIRAGERIGLVGSSGSGKSTLCDLILGLLMPSSGKISVDGRIIESPLVAGWQKNVGYVPQEIFLIDDSVYRNVSGNTFLNEQQKSKARRACLISSASDFVEELPLQYESRIGDNANLISGGQKQRLGIAKAMYRDVSLIVLDEATSALDASTEAKILEALSRLPDDVSQIIISHRPETLKHCDRIFELRGGELFESKLEDLLLEP